MGDKRKFYVQSSDGNFVKYDDTYDITIHFDTQDEQERFLYILKQLNDLKMELPGQQEKSIQDIHK